MKKILVLLLIIGAITSALYIHTYQSVVNKGSLLLDEHCIKVNPLIIDRKNKYLVQYDIMMATGSAKGSFMKAMSEYNKSSKAYIKGESEWLPKQRKFLDSMEFNLLMPSYVKNAANFQYQIYEADYNSQRYLAQAFEEKDEKKGIELSNKATKETNKRTQAENNYDKVWETGGSNWTDNFIKIPPFKCPAKNQDMPNMPVIENR